MLNKVILIGHLGQDPEVRYTQGGAAVCNLSIATKEKWLDKNSGELKENTEWHRVVLFREQAEKAGEHLQKGAMVVISGKIKTRTWQKDGVDQRTTEILCDPGGLRFLSRPQGNGNGNRGQRTGQGRQRQQAQSQQPQQQKSAFGGFSDDEDIPF